MNEVNFVATMRSSSLLIELRRLMGRWELVSVGVLFFGLWIGMTLADFHIVGK